MNKLDGEAMAMRLGLRGGDRRPSYLGMIDDSTPARRGGRTSSTKKTSMIVGKVDITPHRPSRKKEKGTGSVQDDQDIVKKWKEKIRSENLSRLEEFTKKPKKTTFLPIIKTPKPANKSSFRVLLSDNQKQELKSYEPQDGSCIPSTPRERHFKRLEQFDQDEQKNLPLERPRSPTSIYIAKCQKLQLIPEPLIAKALASRNGTLDLTSYGVGDQLVKAVAESLSQMDDITTINLKGNRLSDKGVKDLLRKIQTRTIKHLDLSENQLGFKATLRIADFMKDPSLHLYELNLENNQLQDRAVQRLVRALLVGNGVAKLNLTRCGISNRSAAALSELLKCSMSLRELYLGWNKIRGAGAVAFAQGLQRCDSLRTLDLSWNAFGSVTGGTNAAIALAEALSNNETLVHLDISYNRLRESDCKVLSSCLENNHTLLGLHLAGNDMELDSYGFVLPNAELFDPTNAHIFTRISDRSTTSQKHWEKRSNCWICEHWSETRFHFDPTETAVSKVEFKAEFDYWQSRPMVKLDDGTFEIFRMAPPGNCQYYFVVDGRNLLDDTQPIQSFQKRMVGGVLNYINGVPRTVNNFLVDARPNDIDITLKARYLQANDETEDWFLTSVFNSYKQDTPERLRDAFESDWNMSRLKTMFTEPQDQDKIKENLFHNFVMLKNVFKQYSAAAGDPFTMGSNAFSDFIADCNIVDDASCTRANIDMAFITANLSGPKCKANPKRSLLRFQFLEIVASLAIAKFSTAASPVIAVRKLLNEYIVPNAVWHDSQSYRNGDYARLYCRTVDMVIREHLGLLQSVFDMLCGNANRLLFTDFMTFIESISVLDETLASREVKLSILYCKETHVNEIAEQEALRSVSFVEFVEALCRIADIKDFSVQYSKFIADARASSNIYLIAKEIGVIDSDLSDWAAETGKLDVKLKLFLKLVALPLTRNRKGLAPKMARTIVEIGNRCTS